MKKTVRIGVTSLVVTQADKDRRTCFDRLIDFCESRLPGCGCDVVVLPEQYESRPEDRQPLDGRIGRAFGALAREHKLYLVAPLAERRGGRSYNAEAVFAPSGRCIHVYRKVHLAPGEARMHAPGRGFRTFELPWFRAGLMTCFDNQFPESTRVLAVQGAQVVFWASFGDLAKPHRNAARCLDSHIYLAGASMIDAACKLPLAAFEQGMVYDPSGTVIAATGPREGLAMAALPLKHGRLAPPRLSHNSLSTAVNYLKIRRPDAYRSLVTR